MGSSPSTRSRSGRVQAGLLFKLETWIYHAEAPGGTFPSSHVAVALCTLYFSWRFIPKIRWIHLIVVILLCASTYCRYHYVVDVFAGMLTGGPHSAWRVALPEDRRVVAVWRYGR